MLIPFTISLLGGLSLTAASPVSHLKAIERSQEGIHWGACNKTEFTSEVVAKVPTSVQCATLEVPLEYSDKDGDKLALSLVKIAAAEKAEDGQTKSILFNFGGPGSEARLSLASFSKLLVAMTGGIYDLVAFNPRGTANTISFQCADHPMNTYSLLADGMKFGDNSTSNLSRLWATAQATANQCADYNNATNIGDKISTPTLARDMMSVVDALQQDGLLRYWGVSYGTTVGATLLALFPDKVEKLILDGVQNPHEYYNHLANVEEWVDADKQFSGIFPACVKHPDACALAKRSPNATAQQLEDQIWKLLDQVQTRPLVYGTQVIDYTAIKSLIAQASYNYYQGAIPKLAATLALYLDLAEHKDVPPPPMPDETPAILTMTSSVSTTLSMLGIQCLDRNTRLPANSSLEDYLPTSKELYGSSRTLGDVTVWASMVCANWKIEPTEKFNSDFKVKPRKPVLILSNTLDGHTPLKSAYNVSSTVENSAVIKLDGSAHSSLHVPSSCLLRTVTDYWVQGKSPKNGTHCANNVSFFDNVTWDDIVAETNKSKRSLPLY